MPPSPCEPAAGLRSHTLKAFGLKALAGLTGLGLALLAGVNATQDANANGDTRTIQLVNQRTQETASITFRRNGSYDSAALKQLDWLCRDWRTDEPTRMEPKLFDILWQVYREVGASEPIEVLSAYRSPNTNAMLRRRSRAVSEHSQHMHGKALDFRIGGVSMAQVREIGMRLQEGGVGFYPGAQFVHLDAGSVRSWPRMTGGELARLFPDGRTVHIPRDGKPMQGYEDAKAVILARGGSVAGYAAYAEAEETGRGKSFWATLFGGGEDEDTDYYRSAASRTRVAARKPATQVAAYAPANSDDDGTRGFFGAAAPAETAPVFGRAGRTRTAALDRASAAPVVDAPPPGFEASAPSPLTPTTALSAGGRLPGVESVSIVDSVPMPPRRPGEITPMLSAAPVPPVRPTALAAVGGSAPVLPVELRGEMRGGVRASAGDDKAALRSLFEAAATPTAAPRRAEVSTSRARVAPVGPDGAIASPDAKVRVVFSSATPDEPRPGAFSGPAVAPLSLLR